MRNTFKQLVPGNPGTSFVVALFYALANKYKISIGNNEQLNVFTEGIVKSRGVFFSGVLNKIARRYGHNVHVFTNSKYLLKFAAQELDKTRTKISLNTFKKDELEKLLSKFQYVVFSVDLYYFMPYHDYHFVCINKTGERYKIFEPKSGNTAILEKKELYGLFSSIPTNLKDILIAFCI